MADRQGDWPAALEKSEAWSTRAIMGGKVSNNLLITKNKDKHLGVTVNRIMGTINNLDVSSQWLILDAKNGYGYAQADKGQIQNKREFSPGKHLNLSNQRI